MTVGYMRQAATTTPMTFVWLLFRWQGSVWKSIHPELFTWLFCFMTISCTYRFVLRGTPQGELFAKIVINTELYLNKVSSSLNFVLGFYVSYVATRWWFTFCAIPWPDNLFGLLSGFFKSRGEAYKKEEQNIRMAISRYWNAAFIIVLRDISASAKKRFPTLEFLVPSVLTREELEIIERISMDDPHLQNTCLYWKAEQHGNITDLQYTTLVQELMKTRSSLNNLLSQDSLSSTPLSYTQVASVAPVIYFVMCLFGRQFVHTPENTKSIDYIFPLYTVYEFIIYFGWLKVSQVMLNPFGVDDDDFEVDWLVQRNFEIDPIRFGRTALTKTPARPNEVRETPLNSLKTVIDQQSQQNQSSQPLKLPNAQSASAKGAKKEMEKQVTEQQPQIEKLKEATPAPKPNERKSDGKKEEVKQEPAKEPVKEQPRENDKDVEKKPIEDKTQPTDLIKLRGPDSTSKTRQRTRHVKLQMPIKKATAEQEPVTDKTQREESGLLKKKANDEEDATQNISPYISKSGI